ncbi:MAG: aldehyde dehydrogenase [Bacteroidetes Order II. Incertae sedis bacterium]|nr:aldehyde dehydrogenase [Bacteroidetes Order II. bacterium]MBT6599307.1 aldehyde dehydrogenase [Bacteroidetes Order II. bacterium]
MSRIQNFINSRFQDAVSGETLDVVEPANGARYTTAPASSYADIEAAFQAASAAFKAWSTTPPAERSSWLNRLADAIEENLDAFAQAESKDSGKPISVAQTVDIPRAIANFRFFATAILQDASEAYTDVSGRINFTVRHPLGVVGCISPWNLPLYLFSWKVAPALAAGNCVIGKPSEVTPYTAHLLGETLEKIGFPAGVFNIVHGHGPEAGAALVAHPGIKAISFTGGTQTGRLIGEQAGRDLKKVSLELGGKNPTLVFADADLDEAVDGAARSAFSNQGQICLCGSRILVEQSIYPQFRDALAARVRSLHVGDPSEAMTQVGALVSAAHRDKVLSYIQLAKDEGGHILCGGVSKIVEGRCEKGYFVAPTLLDGLPADCRTNQEEIFGPVATLMPFETEEEAIALANGTQYGLAASVWTSNVNTAHRVGQALESGIVWINCWMERDLRTPFGGVKSSGMGREGGWYALRFFTEPKNICIKTQTHS